jgi:hypothetical protein
MKYRHAVPALFKELIARFGLQIQPVSKYRVGIAELGFAPPDQDDALVSHSLELS